MLRNTEILEILGLIGMDSRGGDKSEKSTTCPLGFLMLVLFSQISQNRFE